MQVKKNVFIILGIIACTPLIFVMLEMTALNMANPYSNKYALFEKEYLQTETLILGSSHAVFGINPAFFDQKTFNLAINSQTLNYDYQALKDYIHKFKHLKRVILAVSAFSFHSFIGLDNDLKENTLKYNYLHYTPLSIPTACFDYNKKNFSQYKYYFSLGSVSIPEVIVSLFNKRDKIYNSDGFSPNKSIANEASLTTSGKQGAMRHKRHFTSKLQNTEYLEKIIMLLQENNIELIVATTPTHYEYWRHFDQPDLHSVFSAISNLAEKYNFTYYNYFYGDQFDFQNKDFFDGDHLNIDGAEKLSRLLNEHIPD